MKFSTIALIALGIGAFWFWQEKKKQDAAVMAQPDIDQQTSLQTTPVKNEITPQSTEMPPSIEPQISENPALAALPPWTSSPTPGEIELQRDLAAATASGQNLSPILQSAFGPAWDLMVITPEQLKSLPETIRQYYTTDGLARVQQMREYWIANHPGETLPDFLTDEYYYNTLNTQNLNVSQIGAPVTAKLDVEPVTVPTAEQVLAQSKLAKVQAQTAEAEADARAKAEAERKAAEEAAKAQQMAYAWADQQAAQLAQQQSSATQPPQVAQSAAQQIAAQNPEVYYTPGYNPAYDPNLAYMGGAMFNF